MYLSLKWLQEYIPDFEMHSLKHLKQKLDTRLSEVEELIVKGDKLSKLVVAKIEKVEEHPTNKKLSLCHVNVGASELSTIVCGAPNARQGLYTVACLPGGSVLTPGGKEVLRIEEKKMGEVTSQGMLCAPDELGLSDDHSKIIELPESSEIGKDVTNLFSDVVIEIENKALPHRPDTFSHLGIAREFKAIFKHELTQPESENKLRIPAGTEELPLKVKIEDNDHCFRFSALVMDNVRIQPSPLWLQIALSYADVRPINNVVDITNYIMMSIGQPMHAFDYDKLDGKKQLIARQAKAGEKLITLDDKERELEEGMVIVSSSDAAESIAGIMGGQSTEIDNNTSTIVLEAANWEMYQIRRTSRKLGLRSEASTRFEKGISPETSVEAIKLAADLVRDIAGGEVASELQDIYPDPEENRQVKFDIGSVKRFIGAEIEKSTVVDILNRLDLEVEGAEKIPADALLRPEFSAEVTINVPHYRRDIKAKEDILEEISRMYGYENIPPTLPKRDLVPPARSAHLQASRLSKQILSEAGLVEVFTYSMVGKDLYSSSLLDTNELISIPNPISPELAYVRDQIIPSLIGKLKQNTSMYEQFGLFELGRVALSETDAKGLPVQPHKLAWVVTAPDPMAAFRKAKGVLESLARDISPDGLGVTVRSAQDQMQYLHPGQTGDIVLGEEKIGEIGTIHPLVLENFSIGNMSVAAAELDFDKLVELPKNVNDIRAVSNFQAVKRDISFWIDAASQTGDFIHEVVSQNQLPEVRLATTVDIYTGKNGEQSITIRFVIQSDDKTLEQEEIQSVVNQLVEIAAEYGLKPRE